MTRPRSQAAHELFLKGEKNFNAFRRAKLDESRRFFEQAMEKEQQESGRPYPRAMAELVYVLVMISKMGLHPDQEANDALDTAGELAPKAVSADPRDYNNHWALGFYHAYSGADDGPGRARSAYGEALRLFNEATDDLDRRPGLLSDMGDALIDLGDLDRGLELTWRAIYDVPAWYRWNLANAYRAVGRFQEAIDELDKIDQRPGGGRLKPGDKGHFYPALPLRAAILARQKQFRRAGNALDAYFEKLGKTEASRLLMSELLAPPPAFSDKEARKYHIRWVKDMIDAGILDKLDKENLGRENTELLKQIDDFGIPMERRNAKKTGRKASKKAKPAKKAGKGKKAARRK